MSARSLRKRTGRHTEEAQGAALDAPDAAVAPPAKRTKGHGSLLKAGSALSGESARLQDLSPWRRWGPYLSERQWGTVREDYSSDGNCWQHFPYQMAAYRTYQWGEDGLFGMADEGVNVCLGLALWNGEDVLLKERLFGLTGPQGNHGEDVKELYYYQEALPSHSYLKALYKYPQAAFPYEQLVEENSSRSNEEPEFELLDTGVFCGDNYWDVEAEYAKTDPGTLLCQYTVHNRSQKAASITVLPQVWFRNTWSWETSENNIKPSFEKKSKVVVSGFHPEVGRFQLTFGETPDGEPPTILFTENVTNTGKMANETSTPGTKDAFHSYIIKGDPSAVNTSGQGTKVAGLYSLEVDAGGSASVRYLLTEQQDVKGQTLKRNGKQVVRSGSSVIDLKSSFTTALDTRRAECKAFYRQIITPQVKGEELAVATQAYAGLIWSKQFFFYDVDKWYTGSKEQRNRINGQWRHMVNKDIVSMPDKWEFPWYATWDLAFHMVPFIDIDIEFAKHQLLLFLSDRYMHPNGQLPAYEFNFSDVNPPVHAWACLHMYRQTAAQGAPDVGFLKTCFHRLLFNFNWWTNQKRVGDTSLYAGGFLGMDNITAVERSHPPPGSVLKQADGTGWMAFFSSCMLQMALQLAKTDHVYVDMAEHFFHQFVAITNDINDQQGLWDSEDNFYYDHLEEKDKTHVLRVRSLVGLLPMVAVTLLQGSDLEETSLSKMIKSCSSRSNRVFERCEKTGSILLSVPSREQVGCLLARMLDQNELLSPHGIRSLSKSHSTPFSVTLGQQERREEEKEEEEEEEEEGEDEEERQQQKQKARKEEKRYSVAYCPGESDSAMFGGNSNWRGPIWICLNFLLIEALQTYDAFYGASFKVSHTRVSKKTSQCTLGEVADDLAQRIVNIFLPDGEGHRPCHGGEMRYAKDPHWKDLILFSEYFHGDNGRGCGASHQTGWTSLVVCLLKQLSQTKH